jgi:hypothetical protein
MIHVVPGAPYDIKIKEGDEEVPTALVFEVRRLQHHQQIKAHGEHMVNKT